MTDGNPSGAGWATFEARIRERRFARCMERAAASLDASAMDEAREALDEARELFPDRPEIAEFESLIASRPQPSEVLLTPRVGPYAYDLQQQEVPAGWTRVLAAVSALIILFGLFGFGLAQLYLTRPDQVLLFTDVSRPSEEPVETSRAVGTSSTPAAPVVGTTESPQRALPEESPSPPPATTAAKAPEPPRASPAASSSTPAPSTSPAPSASPAPSVSAPDRSTTPSRPRDEGREKAIASNAPVVRPPLSQRSPVTTPVPEPPARKETPAIVTTPPAERRAAVEPAISTLPVPEAETAAKGGVPPPVPALEPPPAPRPAPMTASRAEESAQIRGVLTRYETAYNKLDVSGASSVWPTVDQAALDRAFKGLVSQRVSLGLCDITIVGDIGGASCAGKAKWEPRVGGGLQTADRHWTFNLRKTGESWRIEQVRVR